jgi:ubiquinone/menaquinone biosynthesis C-methylase UbiE
MSVKVENLDLKATYERRFTPDLIFRQKMWQTLCRDFFQKYIPKDSTVLEIASGYCEFINNIQAKQKLAIDLNPDVKQFANPDVKVEVTPATDLSPIASNSVDIAFCSNFFEHLTKPDIVKTLQETHRVLKPGGKFLVLQPNIRFCGKDYWMFFDHITPLDDRSLTEVLEVNNFEVKETLVRFLPYTTKSRLPKADFLIKLYLKMPLAWRIFGQQTFIVAQAKKEF